MIARLRPVLLATLLLPTLAFAPAAQAFDLDALEAQLATPERLQGHFRQFHWLADQEVRLHSQGRFLFQRDQQLIWLFESPTRQVLSFTPERLSYVPESDATESEAEQDQARSLQGDIEALLPARRTFQRQLVALMGGDLSALGEEYHLTLSGDREAWQVALRPRASTLELPLATLTLSGGEHPERLDMAIANGDSLSIRLSDTEEVLNESLVPWLVHWLIGDPTAAEDAAPLEDVEGEKEERGATARDAAVETQD
ncbi:outer membrane lipoprotein carrier protein LolA [Halomonas sp. YLGW01]|uniref:LolA family protein n=1 Tax=Halomonas sp. YLGW01 TaxID=2773308 RepID=UPI001780DFF1|nr:outer membrane lipoprotein carrier protein LolA [Halomonas sp. YLGW01]